MQLEGLWTRWSERTSERIGTRSSQRESKQVPWGKVGRALTKRRLVKTHIVDKFTEEEPEHDRQTRQETGSGTEQQQLRGWKTLRTITGSQTAAGVGEESM